MINATETIKHFEIQDAIIAELEQRNKELEEALEGKEEILQMYRKQFPKVFNKVMDLYQKQSLKEGKEKV